MSILLENLNPKQQEAVLATEGLVRVVAGAGSGKTRVLAHRYAFIVEEIGIDPSNILCMTFTNKAAQEMRARINKLLVNCANSDLICTIHGFCVKVLRRDIVKLGYPKSFIILDEEDCKSLAKQVMEDCGIDRTKDTVRKFLNGVAAFKDMNPDYIPKYLVPGVEMSEDVANQPIIKFLQAQQRYYSLDFDDLMNFALYILENFDDVKDYWQNKLNYVQIDEVQDCNANDWKLINCITGIHKNLFVVGDPDQAIYEWRGSKPDMFVNFKSETDIVLAENYRSTPDILKVANSVIAHNKNRIPKDLMTQNLNGKKTIHYHGKNEADEASWIIKQIKNLHSIENCEFSNFAILYRASYLSRSLEKEMIKNQMPYTIWGGIRFFERKEIKDILAYLQLVDDDRDLAFRRIINVPARKFGKATLKKLETIASENNLSLYQALKSNLSEPPFNKKEYADFVRIIEEGRQIKNSALVSDLTDMLLKKSGLLDLIRSDEDEERLENVKEFMNDINRYEETATENGDDILLYTYLQDIALYTNMDFKNNSTTIKLMTMHQAKGLEFPYVFVCGMSEGIFPSYRALQERKMAALEEERRLMYVAVTRAEKALFLTESEGYNISFSGEKYPSRFLMEIDSSLINVKGDIDPYLITCSRRMASEMDKTFEEKHSAAFEVGDTVIHKIFGVGTIIEINGKPGEESSSVKVLFDQTNKTRDLNPAKLTKA